MDKLYAIYFSATGTTRECVTAICQGLGSKPCTSINLADGFDVAFPDLTEEDVAVVAAPVYGGRLPLQVSTALARLKGNKAAAIAVAVYGNRDYDDALLELTDLLHGNKFRIAGAGAFIGQHAIFPQVAPSRPDASDEQKLARFGRECQTAIANGFNADSVPYLKGNRPYKKPAGAPLSPRAAEADCVKCGQCAARCPVGAISEAQPFKTDKSKCISCGRCITLCPQSARHHSGLAYSLVGFLFKTAFSKRKEPEWTIAPTRLSSLGQIIGPRRTVAVSTSRLREQAVHRGPL